MGLLDNGFDPTTQGLLSAAFQGLQASGPSRMPVSLGQIIGQAGSAGLNEYQKADLLQRQKQMAQIQMQAAQQEMEMNKAKLAMLQQKMGIAQKIFGGGVPSGTAGGVASIDPQTIQAYGAFSGSPEMVSYGKNLEKQQSNSATGATMQGQAVPITDIPTAGYNQNGVGVRSIIPPGGPMVQPPGATEPIPPEVAAAARSGQPFAIGVGPSANPAENTQKVGGLFAGEMMSPDPLTAQQGLLSQNQLDKSNFQAIPPEYWQTKQATLAAQTAARQQQKTLQDFAIANRNPSAPVAVMGPDNKPIYVTSQEAIGKIPATAAAINTLDGVDPAAANLHGEDYIATLPPGQQNVVRGLINYSLPLNNLSMRSNERKIAFAQAAQADPNFNAAKYGVRQKVMSDFTSGPTAKNVTAINTAIAHLGTMDELASALESGSIPAINKVVQTVQVQTGDPRVTNFDTAKQAVATEVMRVFRQVNASSVEMKDWEGKFNTAASPEQLRGAMKTAASILKGRIGAVNDMWNRGMDQTGGYPGLLSDQSKAVLGQFDTNLNAPAGSDIRSKADAILRGQYGNR